MNFSLKKCGIAACIMAVILLAWINLRPVELVAVHQDDQLTYILVRNFSLRDRGKIAWWLEHADELKAKYAIPRPGPYGLYFIIFWDFGDGYKEDAFDLFCFNDMKTKKNCVDKNFVFMVNNTRDGTVVFTTDVDKYTLKNGKIVPYKI